MLTVDQAIRVLQFRQAIADVSIALRLARLAIAAHMGANLSLTASIRSYESFTGQRLDDNALDAMAEHLHPETQERLVECEVESS